MPNTVTDHRPIIAYVMRHCGATVREIGEVFGVSRQQAETIYKNAQEKADNHYEI
jgi:transcriptional regulator